MLRVSETPRAPCPRDRLHGRGDPAEVRPRGRGEAGWELARLGAGARWCARTRTSGGSGVTERITAQLEAEGIAFEVYDDIRVEPSDESFAVAAAYARDGGFDAFVSIGGGSTIDTAKVANLISTHGGEVVDYVNAPVGGGRKPDGPLGPHLAIPTTSGSGSEATTVAVLDVRSQGVKSGISHRFLRASQAIVDPELTRTLAAEVTSSAGLDVICHAAESFLARPVRDPRAPASPATARPTRAPTRSPTCGPRALEDGGRYLRRAVADGDDVEARGRMMLCASLAGIGFGSAGVPHPPRLRLPDRHRHAGLPARRLPGRPPVRPPRALGDRHLARRLPLHLRGRARAPHPRRRAAAGRPIAAGERAPRPCRASCRS